MGEYVHRGTDCSIKASLSQFLEEQADWRSLKADEHPDDERNAETETAIRRLTRFIRSLHDDDPRLVALGAVQARFGTDVYLASEGGSWMLSRFGGFDRWSSEDAFLRAFVDVEIGAEA